MSGARLRNLLADCLVQINCDDPHDSGPAGSGFFVAPGYVLTCSHVARRASGSTVTGTWRGHQWSGEVAYASSPPSPDADPEDSLVWPLPDLAVIRLAGDLAHPCARFSYRDHDEDTMYFGVGLQAPFGGLPGTFPTANLHYSGVPVEIGSGRLIRLTGENLLPGMSGGPALDLGTGEVCGVLKSTGTNRDCYIAPLGLMRELPGQLLAEMERGHDWYHQRQRTWVREQDVLWEQRAESRRPPLKPTEEADLMELLTAVTDIGNLDRLYWDCMERDPLSPEPGMLRTLRDLVFRLYDHSYDQRRLHPVIVLAELLARRHPQLLSGLQRWSAAVAGRQDKMELLRDRERAPRPSPPQATWADPMSVVVQLEPYVPKPELLLLTIWRYRNRHEIAVVLRDHAPHDREEVVAILAEQVPRVIGELSDGPILIEFVLPLELYDEAVHQWRIFQRGRVRLGIRYPVVIRDRDRLIDQTGESQRHAKERWDLLDTRDDTPVHWLTCTSRPTWDETNDFFESLEQDQAGAFGLPGPADEFADAMEAAVSAGTPVALWSLIRCDHQDGAVNSQGPCDGMRFTQAANHELATLHVSELPAKLRQLRARADGPLANAQLLWDNPFRGPHPRGLAVN